MYKTFQNWLFDGNLKNEIPSGSDIPDILKYNSPITNTYMVGMFVNQGKLNHFLNQYFNNIGLYYIDKKEMMKFIKKCVIDFKIQRRNLPYIPFVRNTKLFEVLKKKNPNLKKYDVSLLSDIVNNLENKDDIYFALGLEKEEKIQKKTIKKETKKDKITIDEFIKSNFKTMELDRNLTP